MTRIFTEGFEMGDQDFWTQPSDGGQINGDSVTGPRSGNYCWTVNGTRDTYKMIDAPLSEFYLRFAWQGVPGNNALVPNVFWFRDGLTVIAGLGIVQLYGAGNLGLWVAGNRVALGSRALWASTWYLVEAHVKLASAGGGGIIESRIDGIADASWAGATNVSGSAVSNFYFSNNFNGGALCLDDLALNDTGGGQDNGWCGDGHVVCLMPNAAGDVSQLGVFPTGTANYADVKERPADGNTTYVYSGVTGTYDLYNLDDAYPTIATTGSSILRVWPELRGEKLAAAAIEVLPVLKTGGLEFRDASALGLFTSYALQIQGAVRTVNPNGGAPWSIADLNSIQVGPEVVP
jgi:hypothetical protein